MINVSDFQIQNNHAYKFEAASLKLKKSYGENRFRIYLLKTNIHLFADLMVSIIP